MGYKTMKKKSIILFALLNLINIYPLLAQSASPFFIDLRLGAGLPQGEFKNNVQNNGFDFTGDFLYHFPGSPLLIGASMSYVVYGSETRSEPFSYTIPDVTVDVTTTNSIIMGDILLRVQGKNGPIIPYGEGILGISYLTTDTRIDNLSNDEEIASSNNFNDLTYNYGAGGGLKIRVYQNLKKNSSIEKNDLSAVYIDINYRYIKGGEAEYLKEGSVGYNGTKIIYDVKKSTTDINIITIGATLVF